MTVTDLSAAPPYIAGSRTLRSAYEVASVVHAGPLDSGRVSLAHPVAVATLLQDAGYPSHVVAAALLHDVVEDGGVPLDRIQARFGPRVARLVGRLTEDPAIRSFSRRKAALRTRAIDGGDEAAAIFAADKLATVQALLRRGEVPKPEKLEHYEHSLWLLRARQPSLPFLDELEADLTRLRARRR